MSLTQNLENELKKLVGQSSSQPTTVNVAGPNNIDLTIDFTAVDSMSCSFSELRLSVPSLANSGVDELKEWAENLSKRVTYLLENIGPLEIDPAGKQILIRSNPPDQQGQSTKFYEILLQSQNNGQFSLKRFVSEKGKVGRQQVDVQITHEVLTKLVNDLVDTIPAATP